MLRLLLALCSLLSLGTAFRVANIGVAGQGLKLKAVTEVASGEYKTSCSGSAELCSPWPACYSSSQSTDHSPLIPSPLQLATSPYPVAGALDGVVSAAGDKLVVIDYSTTWCGPCKMVLPKYVELSDKYPGVTFLKCIGDSSAEASALMKREGVRSVPTFHFWKNGQKLDTVNGARIEEVEAAVVANTKG